LNPDSLREPRLRDRLRRETSRAIVEAAEAVFARRGLREARMEEIAQRAGVSVGTLYNHFEDRGALLVELIESRRKALALRIDGALAGSAREPFAAQLRALAACVFEHFEEHRQFLSIMLEADTARLERPSPAMVEIRARVEALVARGVRQGSLRPQGKQLWPAMLLGAMKALLIHELRNPGQLSLEERVDAVVDFFLNGARA
jgi:AcrR family transcriptional regulator